MSSQDHTSFLSLPALSKKILLGHSINEKALDFLSVTWSIQFKNIVNGSILTDFSQEKISTLGRKTRELLGQRGDVGSWVVVWVIKKGPQDPIELTDWCIWDVD